LRLLEAYKSIVINGEIVLSVSNGSWN